MKPVRDSLVVPELKRGTDSQYELTTFEKPLSYRKDAGFTMDTSAIDLPLKMSMPGAPHVVEYCDGKIVYMGKSQWNDEGMMTFHQLLNISLPILHYDCWRYNLYRHN
jgi:hypothetical protein